MRILIVEDELPIAEDILFLVKDILKQQISSIHIETTLGNAQEYLRTHIVDVLLLDLNLNSKDGFQLLKQTVSNSFHTIVISANTDRAIEAFEYGVLDFIPKPYSRERIEAAFKRIHSTHALDGHSLKYITVKRGHEIHVIPLEDIHYFKSANIYVELHLNNKQIAFCDKSMKTLAPLLPSNYFRIHKSYIIDINNIDTIQTLGGGQYRALLKSGDILPVSRQRMKLVKQFIGL
ncbi:MAG: LytTR family two component transcriptional regulator [Stygiobacter sp.]|nr:MAG: LytTR family two component transcriptional regulator [Stygiobacter sp.]KAF0214627.1 MAG: LytTR family two component transcriptional [Ignavibacteria bacterium]